MTSILLLLRVGLAGVLAAAALGKLADLPGSRKAVREFGVPSRLAGPLGIALPAAEILIAGALLPAASAWWAAGAALALFLAFAAGMAYNLAQGRRPDCHCFGRLHSSPIGWSSLARDGALAAVATLVVVQGSAGTGPSAVAWLAALGAWQQAALLAVTVLLALVTVEGWFLLQLFHQHGRLLSRLDALEQQRGLAAAPVVGAGWPVGQPAPAFRLPNVNGEPVSLATLLATGKPVLLLFSDPNCGPCQELMPQLARWQRNYLNDVTVALISRGKSYANRQYLDRYGLGHVLLQQDFEVAQAYQVPGTPSALLIRADGKIGSAVAGGAAAIEVMMTHARQALDAGLAPEHVPGGCSNCDKASGHGPSGTVRQVVTVGRPAPAFRLPDLAGQAVGLADLRGQPTLLLFWNPGCGFCMRMMDNLKAWEAEPPAGAPRLVLVAAGSREANLALALRSTVLLDPDFSLGHSLGIDGTPSAVLLDGSGNIGSSIAVGADGVLALAGSVQSPVGMVTASRNGGGH
jgi:methylamine dehydrogenase accessory protein MauD